MTFYDNVKEDVRPWRADQDTRAQAKDDAAVAHAAALVTETAKMNRQKGIIVTPRTATITVASPTVQLTANQLSLPSGTVVWTSSDPTKATVNASTGLVTRVANGTTNITATVTRSTGGKNAGIVTTGVAVITVTS